MAKNDDDHLGKYEDIRADFADEKSNLEDTLPTTADRDRDFVEPELGISVGAIIGAAKYLLEESGWVTLPEDDRIDLEIDLETLVGDLLFKAYRTGFSAGYFGRKQAGK